MATKCPVCGAPLENGSCGYCGYSEKTVADPKANAQQQPMQQPVQQIVINNAPTTATVMVPSVSKKSKTVALLLCIFLGPLGAHRFYVGKGGSGFLYLITIGVCGFGWLIDIFRIAAGSFKDCYGLPLK